MQEEYRR